MAFVNHFEGGERLLRLIVVVELPRQIRDREQNDDECRDDPWRAAVFEQTPCHVERSRDIPRRSLRAMPRGLIRPLPVRSAFGLPVHVAASPPAPFSTPLGMTVICIHSRQSTARTGAPSPPAIFRGSAAKL